jgi:hypothetical protein
VQLKSLHSSTLRKSSRSGKLSAKSSTLKHNSVGFPRRWLDACNLQHNTDTHQMNAAHGFEPSNKDDRTRPVVCGLHTDSISQSIIFSVIHLLSHGHGVSIHCRPVTMPISSAHNEVRDVKPRGSQRPYRFRQQPWDGSTEVLQNSRIKFKYDNEPELYYRFSSYHAVNPLRLTTHEYAVPEAWGTAKHGKWAIVLFYSRLKVDFFPLKNCPVRCIRWVSLMEMSCNYRIIWIRMTVHIYFRFFKFSSL